MMLAEISLPAIKAGPALSLLLGIALLLFGRRLFWLFVGAVGFIAGMEWGAALLGKQPEMVALIFAVAVGIVCALLAVLVQRLAVAIAGGVVGGLFAMQLAVAAGVSGQTPHLVAFAIGAVLAAILVSVLFDWALIILSSLAGGSLLAEFFVSGRSLEMIVALLLCIAGIVFQSRGGAPRKAG
jgi:hypothetical protein